MSDINRSNLWSSLVPLYQSLNRLLRYPMTRDGLFSAPGPWWNLILVGAGTETIVPMFLIGKLMLFTYFVFLGNAWNASSNACIHQKKNKCGCPKKCMLYHLQVAQPQISAICFWGKGHGDLVEEAASSTVPWCLCEQLIGDVTLLSCSKQTESSPMHILICLQSFRFNISNCLDWILTVSLSWRSHELVALVTMQTSWDVPDVSWGFENIFQGCPASCTTYDN